MAKLQFITSCTFNHIYVFQSLRDGDLKCAELLYEDVLKPLASKFGFMLNYYPIKTKSEFLKKLDSIRIEGHKPLIHIDMHGDSEKGIEINPDGKFVSWKEFKAKCQQINIACANNLSVVLASCFGFHAITEVKISEVSPFYLLIGSEKIISAGYIEKQFPQFYNKIFEDGNLDNAMEIIADRYKQFLSDKMFVISFSKYLAEGCIGKGRQKG